MLNQPGIYKITNITNGKFYVGSAINLEKRWKCHKSHLKLNKHSNEYLQKSWIKYGEGKFCFEVLVYLNREDDLIAWEQMFMDALKPHYNMCPTAGSWKGKKHAQKAKDKISEKNRNNKYCVGREMSEETRAKIGDANRGRVMPERTEEYKAAISKWKTGQTHSTETKITMRDCKKKIMKPIWGKSQDGKIIFFECVRDARRAGFEEASRSIKKGHMCRGYRFSFTDPAVDS